MREFRKRYFKHRVAVLLLVLAGALAWRAVIRVEEDRHVDWSGVHRVAICPIVAPGTDAGPLAERFAQAPEVLAEWVAEQHAFWRGVKRRPIEFVVHPPVTVAQGPPWLPDPEDSFWTRWRETTRFFEYLDDQARSFPPRVPDDSRIWLYVYRGVDEGAWADRLSVATSRGRVGVVFASDDPKRWDNVLCVILHETLHSIGAPDHRRSDDTIAHPEGYADPSKEPLFPQEKAEIMALGIPVGEDHELKVDSLDEVVMGFWTAKSIGWR